MADVFVTFTTPLGSFLVDLYADAAPKTVQNFLSYIPQYQQSGEFFHRLATSFVLQGGGYRFDGTNTISNTTTAPVVNEFSPTRSNVQGTIAMAKLGGDPNSATDQFFFNLNNNAANLDAQNGGFTVFGRVVSGWNVVQSLAALPVIDASGGNANSPFTSLPVINYTSGSGITLSNLATFSVAVTNATLTVPGASPAVTERLSVAGLALTGASDLQNPGDTLTVTGAHVGTGVDTAIGAGGIVLTGTYGHLTILPSGAYAYTADAEGLTTGQVYADDFAFTTADQHGVSVVSALHFMVTGSATGNAGPNIIVGSAAADTITGGSGADLLTGGLGANTFLYAAAADSTSAAPDAIADFKPGVDHLNLTAVSPTAVAIVQSGNSSVVFVNAPGGAMQINAIGLIQGTDVVTGGVGVAIQGDGAPTIINGSDANDTLFGNGGNDLLSGRGGADVLFGGAGADLFSFNAASDSTAGASDLIADFQNGVDAIDLSAVHATAIAILQAGGNSLIFANTPGGAMQIGVLGTVEGSGIATGGIGVTIQGGAESTIVSGTAANDTLFGEAGDDVLIGGTGIDVLFGGAGFDAFKYLAPADSTAAAPDLIADFQTGIDKIDLRGTGVTAVGIASNTVFASGPGGIAMQIGVIGAVSLADIQTGPAPTPLASPAADDMHVMMGMHSPATPSFDLMT